MSLTQPREPASVPGILSRVKTSGATMIAKHKKSCIIVVGLVVLAIVLIFISAHMWPDGFTTKILPASLWTSADYKLRKKNHTSKTRRDDNKVDNWSKDDFIKSVTKFNNITADVE